MGDEEDIQGVWHKKERKSNILTRLGRKTAFDAGRVFRKG